MHSAPEHGHEPVLLRQVLEMLQPVPGNVVADCTMGRGGHALAMLGKIMPGGILLGLDVDPRNLTYAKARFAEEGKQGARVRFFHANFAEVADVLAGAGVEKVDCLLADLGVSTNQLFDRPYGLSFSSEAPLDMRLDPRIKQTAADLLNEMDEEQIANLIYENAEERFSRRIARKIVQTRAAEPIRTTEQLARLVRSVVPKGSGKIDPATRTFQALRMAVNAETESLDRLLDFIPELMAPGGRAAVISFHSGEDRRVKQATRRWQDNGRCEIINKKPIEPDEREIHQNPRSRSAKLRAVRFN